jgi:hypothetical protein
MGATPITAVLLSAFLLLVVLKFAVLLATTSAEVLSARKGGSMRKRAKLWFAAALDTCHGLGANGWVSYLLSRTVVMPDPVLVWTVRQRRLAAQLPVGEHIDA